MTTVLTVIHIVVCLFLVVIVLLQHGKGADMGATFGGSSQTVFGSDGPLPLLNKVTTSAAIIFMVTSIGLAYLSAHMSTNSVMSDMPVGKSAVPAIERAPATEVEHPDVKLGTDDAENKKDAAQEETEPLAAPEAGTESEKIEKTGPEAAAKVGAEAQPVVSGVEQQVAPEQKGKTDSTEK